MIEENNYMTNEQFRNVISLITKIVEDVVTNKEEKEKLLKYLNALNSK